ncbi:hypothetical protein AJ88_06470 [Mesorhizobium amorphae CCBAU 01583]|nr:hypothetical protein AJ88_06470 [Mesorhizobium amorphae CCBAU 01583]
MGGNNSVLPTQQLSELSSELSKVRANRAAAEATADGVRKALQNGGSLDAVPEVLSSDRSSVCASGRSSSGPTSPTSPPPCSATIHASGR